MAFIDRETFYGHVKNPLTALTSGSSPKNRYVRDMHFFSCLMAVFLKKFSAAGSAEHLNDANNEQMSFSSIDDIKSQSLNR